MASIQPSPNAPDLPPPRRRSVFVSSPASRLWSGHTVAWEVALVLAGSIFLALTARISVTLPFSPVPITGQTLGVMLVGALYGPRRGALTVVAYLLEGLAGAPVFSAGRAGIGVLLGPTGGYIAGFIPAAVVAGALAGARRPVWLRLTGMILAVLTVYLIGVPRLAIVTRALRRPLRWVRACCPSCSGTSSRPAWLPASHPPGRRPGSPGDRAR